MLNITELANRAGFIGTNLDNTVVGTSHYKALSNFADIIVELTEKALIIEGEKDIWIVSNNTDLTEGRGYQYSQYACEKKSTAKRLAHKAGIQGCDAHVESGKGYKINNKWYFPRKLTSPTADDLKVEKEMEEAARKQAERDAILEKAKALGLNEEDLVILRG